MARHIDDVPASVTAAGQSFDYVDPPRFASVVLVNAPLDPDHANIGLDRAAYDTFIDTEVVAGRALVLDDVNLQNPEHDLDVEVEYETASTFYNYGRVIIGGRRWYVFYTPTYKTKTVTRFVADIDEVASYDWSLGYSRIERGHVAVAASQSDTYGDQYLTAPEPVDAPPIQGELSASLLGSAPTGWTVLVVCANDLRGGTGLPFFDQHVEHDLIASAAGLASSATIDSAGNIQAYIPDAKYPWNRDDGAPPSADFFWPFDPSTWNLNNGHPEDAFRTVGRPTHNGLDMGYGIANLTGTPVKAAGAGYVSAKSTTGTYGNHIEIQHPNGYRTTYSHMNAPTSLALGQSVVAGAVLGGIGTTGGSTGNHLHFETYNIALGDFIDPLDFMAVWNPDGLVVGDEPAPTIDVYVPKVTGSPVSTIDGVSAGGGVYLFTLRGFAEYMTIMQGAPWVTSGITDVRLVPSWAVGGGGDAVFTPQKASIDPGDPSWDIAASIPVFAGAVTTATATPSVLANWRTTVLAAHGAQFYRKLVTSQFTDLLVGNGDSWQTFKPDQWQSADLDFVAVTGAAHGDPSIRLIPVGYNELGSQMGVDTPVGGQAGLAHSGYGIAGSNTASQVLTPYLNAYSSHSAWVAALRNKALAVSLGLTQIQLNAGVQGISTVLGAAQGAAGGALSGNVVGGAAAGAIGAVGQLATAGITASNTITMLDASTDGSFDIQALQLALSGEAAVTSFDTWTQSLSAASGGGSPHRLASPWRAIVAQAFDVIVALPSTERIHALLSEWRRFGYMIGQTFKPTRLDPMTKMSYWQTGGAVILGAVPQQRRQTIAAAFDRGTTVWTSIADIGSDVTGSNTPRAGISY